MTSSPTGIQQCGAAGGVCSALFNANQTVTLTASTQVGYTFTGWAGSCSGVSTVTTVAMSQARACTATFTAQYVLDVAVNGTGTVSSTPAGISACSGACSRKYSSGQVVGLTATAAVGFEFQRWAGDCSGTQPTVNVTMSSARSCSATFTGAWARWPMPNPAGSGLPNPASYDTAAAGVVLDKVTGLMWERALDAGSYTWSEAQAYCSSLAVGGFTDWRLPSRVELFSIFDFTKSGVSIDSATFPNTPVDYFWTTSTSSGGGSFFYVHSRYGIGVAQVSALNRVRCVRVAEAPATVADGDTPPTRYTVQNGTVYDNKTKLTWQQQLAPAGVGAYTTYLWADAVAYCSSLSLAGTGWRLPSVKELVTLIDETRIYPAIDPIAFPNTPATADSLFWSSSVDGNTGNGQWFVFFNNTFAQTINVPKNYYARCVR